MIAKATPTRRCYNCFQEKPVAEFHWRNRYRCKRCHSEVQASFGRASRCPVLKAIYPIIAAQDKVAASERTVESRVVPGARESRIAAHTARIAAMGLAGNGRDWGAA